MVVRSRVNVGIEAQCLFEARRRLLEVLQCLMRQREVVMRIGRLRLQSDRTLDAVDRKVSICPPGEVTHRADAERRHDQAGPQGFGDKPVRRRAAGRLDGAASLFAMYRL
jgi:hypothetical protein